MDFTFYSNIFANDSLLVEKLVDTEKIELDMGLYQMWAMMGNFKDNYQLLTEQFAKSKTQLLELFKQKYGKETTYEELKDAAHKYRQQMEQDVQRNL